MTKCAYCDENASYRDRASGDYLCLHHVRLEVVGPHEGPPRPLPTIRPSTPADGRCIAELADYFWNETDVHCFGRLYRLDAQPAHVACDGDEIVAAASYAREGDAVNLVALLVLPQWQGQGVARELIARVIETARAERASRVIIATANDNPLALAFYQRLGFVITGILVGEEARYYGKIEIGFAGIPVRDEIQLEMRL